MQSFNSVDYKSNQQNQQSNRYQNWLEINKFEITRHLETACLIWLNQQIQEFGYDPVDFIQETASGKFETILFNGKKTKCGYAFDKQDTFLFIVTFNYFKDKSRSFNTGETLSSLWNNGKPDLNAFPLKTPPQPIVKPLNPDKLENDKAVAQNALASDLALFKSLPNSGTSAYLDKKHLSPISLIKSLRFDSGFIMLAIQNVLTNETIGFQKIYDNGDKRFTKGLVKHNSAIIIDGDSSNIAICEGFATGATINKATGYLVYCALDASNIESVANSVKQLYFEQIKDKTISIVICADNDSRKPTDSTKENTGIIKAYNAALKNRLDLTYPLIGEYSFEDLLIPNEQIEKVDFNDLLVRFDIETVAYQIEENRFKPKVKLSIETKQAMDLSLGVALGGKALPKQKFSLKQFGLTSKLEELEMRAKEEKFVLEGIALTGQITAIYAPPNTGKTLIALHLIIKEIVQCGLNPDNIMYINVDDTSKGLPEKVAIAKEFGFEMIADNEAGFKIKELTKFLQGSIDNNDCNEIIILDTLKKVVDLMDKKASSDFMKVARNYVQKGGTMILLGHTNKNKGADGKHKYGGTSDIVDDCDCAYIASLLSEDETFKTVVFENEKIRGSNELEVVFKYRKRNEGYLQLLQSVKTITNGEIENAKKQNELNEMMAKDKPSIEAIKSALNEGITKKLGIIDHARDFPNTSRRKIDECLGKYIDILWSCEKEGLNAFKYKLIK